MFSTHPKIDFNFSVAFFLSSASAFCLDLSKNLSYGKELTHYQMTNFRLFQTERVCRRQLQILWKWHKVIQTGRKHCGKRRNCSLWAISPFPTVFSNGWFPRGVKRCHCVGMGAAFQPFTKQQNFGIDQHFLFFCTSRGYQHFLSPTVFSKAFFFRVTKSRSC